MIESRNSMGMLFRLFNILGNASRVSTFRLGMQTIPKKSVYSSFLILFENSFDGLKAGIS
jgi:hypothetical protein